MWLGARSSLTIWRTKNRMRKDPKTTVKHQRQEQRDVDRRRRSRAARRTGAVPGAARGSAARPSAPPSSCRRGCPASSSASMRAADAGVVGRLRTRRCPFRHPGAELLRALSRQPLLLGVGDRDGDGRARGRESRPPARRGPSPGSIGFHSRPRSLRNGGVQVAQLRRRDARRPRDGVRPRPRACTSASPNRPTVSGTSAIPPCSAGGAPGRSASTSVTTSKPTMTAQQADGAGAGCRGTSSPASSTPASSARRPWPSRTPGLRNSQRRAGHERRDEHQDAQARPVRRSSTRTAHT